MSDQHDDIPASYKASIMKTTNNMAPYWQLLGMELLDFKQGWAIVKLPFDTKLTNPTGIAHGGAVFSVADAAAAMAAMGTVGKDEIVTTIEMKTNYVKPFIKGEITGEAKIVYKGTTTALGDVDVRNENGELIAKGQATYMILKAKRAIARQAD
ncbi:MAG: PaaI family thioesterase [Chloroflexi bacterium]|jgi:uncharacterized protein (TIGR00369 family)|nr:PaaI family thioesterase [Chloroflexota bacterium]